LGCFDDLAWPREVFDTTFSSATDFMDEIACNLVDTTPGKNLKHPTSFYHKRT